MVRPRPIQDFELFEKEKTRQDKTRQEKRKKKQMFTIFGKMLTPFWKTFL